MRSGWVAVGYRMGSSVVVPDDAIELAELLGSRQLATAESCTGGLLAQRLARAKGSSDWYKGGVVAYQRETKFAVLEVTPGPVVTERAATEMAWGVAKLLDAEVALAITGAAGPAPQDGAAPGTVVIGLFLDGDANARTYYFAGTPEEVCEQASDEALHVLRRAFMCPRSDPDDLRRDRGDTRPG